jgi:HlyD family secretion protein
MPRSDDLIVRQFQSETDAIREAPDPIFARSTLYSLAGLLLALLALSFIGKLDRVISSSGGQIVAVQSPMVFQALDASIIKTLDVHEGDVVAAGQLLATLDPTFAAADVTQLRQQIAGFTTQVERATAEINGAPLAFTDEEDPIVKPYAMVQRELYAQRAAALAAQIKSFDEKIGFAQSTLQKLKQDESRYQDRERIAQQIEDMRSKLRVSGSGSLLNLLNSTDSRLEMLRELEQDHNSLLETEHNLASLAADKDAAIQQWKSTTSQDLVTAKASLEQANAQLTKALKHQDLVRLTAPEAAFVLNIAKTSVGSVLREGDGFMTLVPLRSPLEAEIQIASRDVGFIRAGDPCVVKIDAFNSFEHGYAEGRIRYISEGAFTTDGSGKEIPPYYKARVAIEKMRFIAVPANFRLIPGMTLSADVKVGTRSVFRYLMGGFIRGAGEAMREP